MLSKNIGALTIGHSPRPDLVAPLLRRLPPWCQLLQAGALDGLEATSLPPITAGTYPLTTRLGDGTSVTVEETFLAPRLQGALNLLEAEGVAATLLLCAGTFAELRGNQPLFKPFNVGRGVLHTLGMRAIGLIAPIREQEAPILRRWQGAGFTPTVWTADLSRQDQQFVDQLQTQIRTNKLECLVLDYVGHLAQDVRRLQETALIPVLDLGQLAIEALAGTV